ncbi:hypothetical protein ACJIZ3_012400 [Penstemon smallii]|uniref:Uncharacterized protein n=1 Tax=Penstemon smallii TaxID=265156 RepID=A0ABD3UR67_9LAMI
MQFHDAEFELIFYVCSPLENRESNATMYEYSVDNVCELVPGKGEDGAQILKLLTQSKLFVKNSLVSSLRVNKLICVFS